jgi:hypothetical protein
VPPRGCCPWALGSSRATETTTIAAASTHLTTLDLDMTPTIIRGESDGYAWPWQPRTRLLSDFVVEDPEFRAEPFTMNVEWDYAPKQRMLRFGCEPAEARRFTFQ